MGARSSTSWSDNWPAFDQHPRASSANKIPVGQIKPTRTQHISRNLSLVNFLLLLSEDLDGVDSLDRAKCMTKPRKRQL